MTKLAKFQQQFHSIKSFCANYWHASWWHKTWLASIAVILVIIASAYSVAEWYKSTQPAQISGVSFIPDYAESLGLNPGQVMTALETIGVKHFRLVSYWDEIEPSKGQYNFQTLDWEFASARASGAKISLAIGLRQPRWPECHAPSWIDTSKPASDWQNELETFMTKVINRYKNSPALESYQLENEYFNNFGECYNFSRSRLVSEYNLVKKIDPRHLIILTRSNNYPNLPIGQPRPDIFGEEIYRRVWNPQLSRFFTYPQPSWYYGFLAGATKLATGRDSILTEVQAEPWLKPGETFHTTSLAEQNQTFSAKIFQQNIALAKSTGLAKAYYWGASYWYYRMIKEHDATVWHVAEQLFAPN